MSKTIDEKVVEMRFDNKNFESNVRDTMSTLDKFKQKLNLTGASKGLENINTSAKKIDMSGMTNALETARVKFSALEVVGVTALANITNSAVNAGKRIVKSLTIDPVNDGFKEYEMTLNAVQTTMAGTGKTAKEVEKELKKLDEYADKTVYSTSDMLNNLPKFTNAGVDLEKATTAMIGIANATALAGGDASKASIAFYNLGQAIGTGYLSRMDYNSINNAGIATMEWKEQMIEAAIAAGTLTKAGDDLYKAGGKTFTMQQLFIDGLQTQWATTDVMMKVFEDYGNETTAIGEKAMSAAQDIKTFTQMMESLKATAGTGWKDTWQIIFGDLDEAKEFWTGLSNFISNIITGVADFRNRLLESTLGRNFKGLLDNINKSADSVKAVVNEVKDYAKVVDEIIGGQWGNGQSRWNKLAEAGYDWAHAQNLVNEKLGDGTRHATNYKEAQNGVATTQEKVNEITADYIVELTKLSDAELKAKGYTDEQIKAFRELAKVAKQTGIPLKEFIENIDKIDGRYLLFNSFKNVGMSLVSVFKSMGEAWRNVFPPASGDTIFNIIAGMHKLSLMLRNNVEKNAENLTKTLRGLFSILGFITDIVGGGLKIALTVLKTVLSTVFKLFGVTSENILEFTAKIGDAIYNTRKWIKENSLLTKTIETIVPIIVNGVKALKDWIDANETIQKGIRKVKDGLKSFRDAYTAWLEGLKETDNIPKYIIDGLVNGIKNNVPFVLDAFIEFGKGILAAIKGVLGIHSPSREFFEIGQNIIQGLINGIKSGVSAVFGFIKSFGLKCVEIFKSINFGKLLAAGISIGLIVVVKDMIDAIQSIANIAERVTAPLQGLGDLLDGIGDYWRDKGKAKKIEAYGNAMKSMAISIAILAGAIWLLAKIDVGTLWATIGAIVALTAILGGLAFAASKMSKLGDFGKSTLTLLTITGSLFIIALAMKKLASIKPEEMTSVIQGLAAMIIGLSLLIVAIGRCGDLAGVANIHKIGKMIKQIAVALIILTVVIKLISKLKGEDIVKGLVVISMFGLFVAGLMAVSKFAGEHANKAGKMIKKISSALLIMIGVIKLASMLKPGEIVKGLAVITGIGLVFAGLIAISRLSGEHANKAGKMMVSMSTAMLIAIGAIKIISSLSIGEIVKGLAVMTGIGLLFSSLIKVSYWAGKHAIKAGTMLMMVSGALLILTGVMYIMGKIDAPELAKSLAVVTVLEALFAGLIYVSQYAGDGIKSIVAMTVFITLLIAALIGLTFIDSSKLLAAAGSLSMIMVALGLLIASTKFIGNAKGIIKTLLPLVGVIALLSGIIISISKLNPQSAMESATALSILLISLSASLAIISLTGPIAMKSIGALAVLSLVVAGLAGILGLMDYLNVTASMDTVKAISVLLLTMTGALAALGIIGTMSSMILSGIGVLSLLTLVVASLAGILGLMDHFDVNPSMETAKALSTLLLTMSASLVILGAVGLMGPAALVGIASLITLVTTLGTLLVGVGALMTKFPQLEEFVNKGIPILELLAYGLGSFFGNIVNGFMTSATSGLPQIGTTLSEFMNNVTPFITGVKLVDKSVLAGVGILSGAILALTATDLINGVISFLSGGSSFAELGTQLSQFMINATPFIMMAKMIDPATMEGIKNLTQAVLILTAADVIQGLTSWLTGGNSLANFGSQLSGLGTSLNQFVTNLGTFNDSQVTTVDCAGKAIKALAEAASEIPNEGGWITKILGENSLATFGNKLPQLGTDLNGFITNLGSFDKAQVSTVDCAGKAIKALAEAAKEIPNDGGLWAAIVGENSLATFGNKLPQLGTDLKGFITNLGSFDEGKIATVDCAGRAIKTLADAANSIPNEGGLWAKIVGDNSLATFAGKLPDLGSKLKEFVGSLGEFSPDQVSTVSSACNAIRAIAKLGEIDIRNTGDGLDAFGKNMVNFAKHVRKFVDNIGEVGSEGITSAIDKTKDLVDMATSVANINIESLNTFGDSLKKVAEDGVKGFVKSFSDEAPKTEAENAVKAMIDALIKGAESKKPDVENKFKSIAEAAVNALSSDSLKDKAGQAGKDFVIGFANGINNNKSLATNAGSSIGKAALAAAKNAIDSHSPSKETHKLGNYFGQGFIIGIKDYATKVYDASYNVAERAKDGLSRAISNVTDIINSDMDTQPTIRPVLDLSSVESGVGSLNGMFNNGPSFGVMSNLRAISFGMNSRNQNGINSDVVSAINKLRKDLGNVGGNTYNIDGITYDDGSNVTEAVQTLVRAATVERRK